MMWIDHIWRYTCFVEGTKLNRKHAEQGRADLSSLNLENAVEHEKDVQAIDLDSVMKKKRAAFRWSPCW